MMIKLSKNSFNKIPLFLLVITALIFSAGAVSAERQLKGDKLDFIQTEEGRVFTALGNVELIYDEIRLTADKEGIYYRYSGEIEFRGNVKAYYREYTAQADELSGNVDQQIYHLTGNAVIEGDEALVKADKIDLYQEEERFEAEGSVYLEYQNFWAEADNAVYYLDRRFIELKGNVRGERDGEKFSSQSAQLDRETSEVVLEGQAELTLPAEEQTEADTVEEDPDDN